MKKIKLFILLIYIIVTALIQWHYLYYSNQPMMLFPSIFLELIAVLGILGASDNINKLKSSLAIQKNGIKAKAVIIDHEIRYQKMKTYYPKVKFKTRDKISITAVSSAGITFIPKKYSKGKKADIAYIPNEPYTFVMIPAYKLESIMGIVLFGCIGLSAAFGSWFVF